MQVQWGQTHSLARRPVDKLDLLTFYWSGLSGARATSSQPDKVRLTTLLVLLRSQEHLDCSWAGPGQPSANFAGPGPRGPGQPLLALALTLKMKKKEKRLSYV